RVAGCTAAAAGGGGGGGGARGGGGWEGGRCGGWGGGSGGGGGAAMGTGCGGGAKPGGCGRGLGTAAGDVVRPLMQKTVYDGVKGFAFCSVVAVQPIMLVVNPSRGIRSVSELIARAKAEPGKWSYGSAGVGGATHLGAELFQQVAGVQLNHIPYAGASPAINDVVGGRAPHPRLAVSPRAGPRVGDGDRLAPPAHGARRRAHRPDGRPAPRSTPAAALYPAPPSRLAAGGPPRRRSATRNAPAT
ncbi:tripartite tricarboxylate transporter substrate-binding protein, partial [Achromobacter ruhlandii]|uniref:tripartite tricarboxylate transporter substrate-binding protein n=1 Tax=Achromobacter ruhlandii TaxID=72557 RepID=UPI0020162840